MNFKFSQIFRDTKLRTKLLLSYLFVVLLPVFLIGYFLITVTITKVLERTNEINNINFQQMKNNIKNKLKSCINLSDNFLSETILMDYLGREYTFDTQYFDKYLDYKKVEDIYERKSPNEDRISIYTSNPTLITDYKFIKVISDKEEVQQWYKDIINAKGKIVIFESFSEETNQMIISFGRLLNIDEASKFTNILILQVPEASLYSLIENEGINKHIYIIDGYGNIMSTTERNYLNKNISSVAELNGVQFSNKADGNIDMKSTNSIMFYGSFNEKNIISDWKIISIISSQYILKDISGIVSYSLLICIASSIIAIIFMILFSNALTKRLKLMVKNMSRIKDGKFDVFISSDQNDEIGELSRSFKSMVDRINNLINEVYLLEIKKKEAEINALQSQINPHFLFNTMESIRMNLWQKGDFETSEIIQKFAKLLRKSIDWASDMVELKKEKELVSAYLEIQKYRYREKLDYDILLSDKLNLYSIPKFTLQPIVENAIYHGIEMKKGKGRVTISSQISEQGLKIIVMDNGIGMDENKLNMVRKQIYSHVEEDKKTKIGIRNVHQRLKLYYGEKFGVSIYSSNDTGTAVEILLPLEAEGGRQIV